MPLLQVNEKKRQEIDLVERLIRLLSASLPENSEERKCALEAISESVSLIDIDRAIPIITHNGSSHHGRKNELLKIISLFFLQRTGLVSATILEFILQQSQVPELRISAGRACFSILFRATAVDIPLPPGSKAYARTDSFLGGKYFTNVLNALFELCDFQPSSSCAAQMISPLIEIEYDNPDNNAPNRLVWIFNETLNRRQLDEALKILILLSEFAKQSGEINKLFMKCMKQCSTSLNEIADTYHKERKSLSTAFQLLTLLLDRHYQGEEALPISVAVQCLRFSQQGKGCAHSFVLAKFLINYTEQAFKSLQGQNRLPGTLVDTLLDCFLLRDRELRQLTYKAFRVVIMACDREFRITVLIPKFFSKMRDFAQIDDPGLHDFVIYVLNYFKTSQQEAIEIIDLIQQSNSLLPFRSTEELMPETLEQALQAKLINATEKSELSFNMRKLALLIAYVQNHNAITDPVLDFIFQQCQSPALTTLVDKACFSLLLRATWVKLPASSEDHTMPRTACLWGREHYSRILDRVNQSLQDSDTSRSEAMLSLLKNEGDILALIERFNYALKYPQFDNAIKIVICLAELANRFEDAKPIYQACSENFIDSVEKIIEIHRAKKSTILTHQWLITLLKSHNAGLRVFAAKVLLICVHRSYVITHIDNQSDYPYRQLRELVAPMLLEKLTDSSLEVRQWASASLCYLYVGNQLDPQLLVSYAEEILKCNHSKMVKIAMMGLGWFIADYHAILSQETLAKVISYCQGTSSLTAYEKSCVFDLLNWQVRRSGLPLPLEMIEQCFALASDQATITKDNATISRALLMMATTTFDKQDVLLHLSAKAADMILAYFDMPEAREMAFHTFLCLIAHSPKRKQVNLSSKFFSKLRNLAHSSDPALHDFVLKKINGITSTHTEIDDIHAIINRKSDSSPLSIESVPSINPSTEKSLDTLLAELKALNADQPKVLNLLENSYLEKALTDVKSAYELDSSFHPGHKPIRTWLVEDCQTWANAVKHDKAKALSPDLQAEIIAVMMRASALDSGHIPRNTQLLVLLLILKLSDNGCLLEVKTSEGKTLITAMFSAMKALQYDYVDVVSSSSILAKREPKETRNFYNTLSLTVAHIIDGKNHDGKAARPCYAANVIYGDTNEYQWDIVREIMQDKITRGDRPYRVLFFDEADSLLVDRAERGAMINSKFPGMEYLKHLLVAVWHLTVRISHSIHRDTDGWIYQPSQGRDKVHINQPHHFITKLLKKYIVKLVEDPQSPVLLSKSVKKFALIEAEEIARASALAHYNFQINRDYLITDNDRWDGESHQEITPIDRHLTGEIQKHTRWTYLHPFLELKHGLKMSTPQLMGNYLSTPGLCRLYGNKIFGVTGTLGGSDTQTLLKEMYGVDLVFVPTYKPKCFVEYEGIIAPNQAVWLSTILHSVKSAIERNRPVLVVAPTITDVILLEKELLKANFCRKVTRYSRNDTDESSVPEHDMEAGEVIVATLLAGRGIDWHFSKQQDALIENAGGLHILVTSLPPNLRVEQQIFGRTARRGNRGTAQIIVNRESFTHVVEDDSYLVDMKNLKLWRDEVEATRINRIRVKSIRLALLKDDLYTRFRQYISSLPSDSSREISRLRKECIEEQWTFWLQSVFSKLEDDFNPETTFQLIESKYESFIAEMRSNDEMTRKNTGLQIQKANLLNFGSEMTKMDFPTALDNYTKAILDDPIVGVQAYYNRAQTHIFMKRENYKEAALSDLKVAKENLEKHIIPQLQSMLVVHNLNPMTKDGLSNEFAKQTHAKIELLKIEVINIDDNIKIIEDSLKAARKKKCKVEFEVSGYQSLYDLFKSDDETPHSEINDLTSSGLLHLFTLDPYFKSKKRSGLGAICVAFLGILQIVVGVLVSYTMPMIGSALIQEGINDLMYSARSLISGNFSWDDYLARKVGSVAITVISMGLDMIKESADLEMAAEASKGKKTLENILKRQLSHNELLERAKSEIVSRLIDTGIRELFSFTVDKLSTETIDRFSHEIKNLIIKRLKDNLDTIPALNAMLMMQLSGSKEGYQMRNLLIQISMEAASEKSNPIQSVADGIIKGLLGSQHKELGVFIKVADMGMAMDKIIHLTDNLSQKIKSKLSYYYHKNAEALANVDVNAVAIASYKDGFYRRIAANLAQRIIAIAKGEIIHPAADMAMGEYYGQLSESIKLAALRPVASENHPDNVMTEPEVLKKPKSVAQSSESSTERHSLRKQLHELKDESHRGLLSDAFEKTRSTTQTHNVVSASRKAKSTPHQATRVYVPNETPKPNPVVSKELVSSRQAKPIQIKSESGVLLDYAGAVVSGGYKGVGNILSGYANAIAHPLDTLISLGKQGVALGLTIQDFRTIAATNMSPGNVINFMDPEFTMLQHLVIQNPKLRVDAMKRMDKRFREFQKMKSEFLSASGSKKTEWITECVVTFCAPGYIIKGGKYLDNYRKFGVVKEPLIFHNTNPSDCFVPQAFINKLTVNSILVNSSNTLKSYMYVITRDGKLEICSGTSKKPDNWGMFKPVHILHPELAKSKSVIAAGWFDVVAGKIQQIDNATGHYLAHGQHLAKPVEYVFRKHGFKDAKGKFNLEYPQGYTYDSLTNQRIDAIITHNKFIAPPIIINQISRKLHQANKETDKSYDMPTEDRNSAQPPILSRDLLPQNSNATVKIFDVNRDKRLINLYRLFYTGDSGIMVGDKSPPELYENEFVRRPKGN